MIPSLPKRPPAPAAPSVPAPEPDSIHGVAAVEQNVQQISVDSVRPDTMINNNVTVPNRTEGPNIQNVVDYNNTIAPDDAGYKKYIDFLSFISYSFSPWISSTNKFLTFKQWDSPLVQPFAQSTPRPTEPNATTSREPDQQPYQADIQYDDDAIFNNDGSAGPVPLSPAVRDHLNGIASRLDPDTSQRLRQISDSLNNVEVNRIQPNADPNDEDQPIRRVSVSRKCS